MSPERSELLAETARLAYRLAPETCWRNAGNGESCAWYHGFWPFLRLLDYGSSPVLHAAFYRDALAPLAAAEAAPRILVSGAADFAMLEVAREAFANMATEPRFTVTDLCETPLALCRHFAEQQGFPIETRRADILELTDRDGFDAIVTHSFLGNFPPKARPPLMRTWFELLKPGGRVITINRLRGAAAPAATTFTGDEAESFIARFTADLAPHREALPCGIDVLSEMAARYLENRRSYPLRTREDLTDLFETAGFRFEVLAELEESDPGGARPHGPTMPGGATYMKVVARRPA